MKSACTNYIIYDRTPHIVVNKFNDGLGVLVSLMHAIYVIQKKSNAPKLFRQIVCNIACS